MPKPYYGLENIIPFEPWTNKVPAGKKLRHFLQHKIHFSPHYNKLFKKNNINFYDIKTTDDLKKIPFTTKKDIAPGKNINFLKLKPN